MSENPNETPARPERFRAPDTAVLGVLLLWALAGSAAWCQTPTIEFRAVDSAQDHLRLLVQSETEARKATADEFQAGEYRLVRIAPFRLYYAYDEENLTPDPEQRCYLYAYLERTQLDGTSAFWYQKLRMSVEGNFLDRKVEIPVTIRSGEIVRSGQIQVTVHQADPSPALSFEKADKVLAIGAPTGEVNDQDFALVNHSGCSLVLGKPTIEGADSQLWRPDGLSAQVDRATLFQGTGTEGELTLRTRPVSWKAFWRSIRPYSQDNPHTSFKVKIPFEVEHGRPALLSRRVAVRFEPAFPLVVLGVIFGAAVGALLGMVVFAGVFKGGERVYGDSSGWRGKAIEILKRLIGSVGIALVTFGLYLFLKGDRAVILFDIPLDPTQFLPAFMIGVLVGIRPVLYYEKIYSRLAPRKQSAAATGTAAQIVLLVLFLGLPSVVAAGQQAFRPTSIATDPATGELYVLDSAHGAVYRIDHGDLVVVAELERGITYTSACFVKWRGESWLAAVATGRTPTAGQWRRALSLVPLGGPSGDRPEAPVHQADIGPNRVHGVACDSEHQRLLLIDPERQGIYQVSLDGARKGSKPALLAGNNYFLSPGSLLLQGSRAIVGDLGREAVVAIDPATGAREVLIEQVSDPAGLSLTPDRRALLVADAGGSRVLKFTFATHRVEVLLASSAFREPCSAVVDRQGHVWVADRWAGKVFEFTPGSDRPIVHAPGR